MNYDYLYFWLSPNSPMTVQNELIDWLQKGYEPVRETGVGLNCVLLVLRKQKN